MTSLRKARSFRMKTAFFSAAISAFASEIFASTFFRGISCSCSDNLRVSGSFLGIKQLLTKEVYKYCEFKKTNQLWMEGQCPALIPSRLKKERYFNVYCN